MKVFVLLAALTGAATCFFIRTHIFVNVKKVWADAQTYCRNNYVDLSMFDTQKEYDMVRNSELTWIGFSNRSNSDSFTQWSDGTLFQFTKWESGQPSGGAGENCGCSLNSRWHDCLCTDFLPFLCFTWEPQVVVVREMMTWSEALEHCRTFYTDLISLPTQNDLLLAKTKITNVVTPSFWAGLRYLDGSWFWLNMEPLGDLVSLPSCLTQPFLCGARKGDVWENRDCQVKMNFVCYNSTW